MPIRSHRSRYGISAGQIGRRLEVDGVDRAGSLLGKVAAASPGEFDIRLDIALLQRRRSYLAHFRHPDPSPLRLPDLPHCLLPFADTREAAAISIRRYLFRWRPAYPVPCPATAPRITRAERATVRTYVQPREPSSDGDCSTRRLMIHTASGWGCASKPIRPARVATRQGD
ncbi:uncharacterized protein PSFLO_04952 [Pseudozyma flocculosa]|uniref:Uncharacterized protein n=1 Tax=Pseudozyma flocculosa TaxID=84751 RepID=A0A5C3F815_9BASI|nr:uncharacterized protein PSFLO_04952 [Pseudozyma flocculosa]